MDNEKKGKSRFKKFIFAIIVILVIVALAVMSYFLYKRSFSEESKYDIQVQKGKEYLSRKKYKKGIEAFENAISLEPKRMLTYKYLANAYSKNKDKKLAANAYIIALEEARKSYDNNKEILADTDTIYISAGNFVIKNGDSDDIEDFRDDYMKDNDLFKELLKQSPRSKELKSLKTNLDLRCMHIHEMETIE